MTAASVFMAAFFCVVGILLPGSGIATLLSTRQLISVKSDPVSRLLVNFSFGVHVNALIFLICWIFFPAKSALAAALGMLAAAAISAAYLSWRHRDAKWRPNNLLIFAVILGGTTGSFAAFNFPTTLDSLQVLQLQQFLLGTTGGQIVSGGWVDRISAFFFGGMHIPAQSGFAGLIFLPSLLQPALPVVTVAAANKILLLPLAAVISLYVSRQLKAPFPAISTILIFTTLVVSQFGLYGLFMTGKDSIFSVLMSIATIAALVSSDDKLHDEPGIFMSAGVLLGVVSIPYLLMFWAIFFACAPKENLRRSLKQAWWCIIPLTIAVVSVREAFPHAGALKISLGLTLAIGISGLACTTYFLRRAQVPSPGRSERPVWIGALLPLACVVAIAAILPVMGGELHGKSAPAPLDGKTGAFDYVFLLYGNNNAGITVLAILALGLGPLMSPSLRTPWSIALFGFLPATSLLVFMHVKYQWNLLPIFNLWDISRDTVQWYAGAIGSVIILTAFSSLFNSRWLRWIGPITLTVAFAIALPSSLPYFIGPWTTRPTLTPSGGFYESISAKAFDVVWREGRGLPIYISEHSLFNENRASYQMYGPQSIDSFNLGLVGEHPRQILFIGAKDVFAVLAAATTQKSSGWVRRLGHDAYAVSLVKDGRSQMILNNLESFSVEYEGAYAPELAGAVPFRWMQQNAKLRVYRLSTASPSCVTLKFSMAWSEPLQKIRITAGSESRTVALAEGTSFTTPHSERICLQFDSAGKADVELSASDPGRSFPGDGRIIAFSLLQTLD